MISKHLMPQIKMERALDYLHLLGYKVPLHLLYSTVIKTVRPRSKGELNRVVGFSP